MPETAHSAGPTQALTPLDRLVLALFALVVLLPGTFGVSLTDRDEGWYAQVSREMVADGDWRIPHYLGQAWLAKPPLLYWCVASSFAVFGGHAWAGRLVSVLAMVGVVQLLGTLAAGLYNRRVGLIAAVSFITAGLPVVVGKMLLTDPLLLLCCLAASVCLWRSAAHGATLVHGVGFWLFVGLAILAKGPAVVVFVGAFALGLLTRPNGRAWLRSPRFWLAFPICLAVAAPWYVYAALHAGGTLGQQFFGNEIVSRLTGTPHGHGGPPGYYLLRSLAGWLPWTALVPGAFFETWRARRADRAAWLLLIWCGLPWVFLELIHSKLPHYILPCYVPLAIMFGRMCDTGLERRATRGQRLVLGLWVAVPIALGAGLIAAAAAWRTLAWSLAAGVAGGVLLAGFLLVAWLVRGRRLLPAWAGAVGVIALFHIAAGLWVLPGFEPYRLSRRIAEQANALGRSATEVLVCGYDEPSLFFYLDGRARLIAGTEIPAALADTVSPRVLILRDQQLRAAVPVPDTQRGDWRRVAGFNYVKWRDETVWVISPAQAGGPGSSR